MQCDILPADLPVDADKAEWWLALRGREALAFAAFKVCAGTTYGYLARSGVYEGSRGLGLQRRLIAARERFAKSIGMTHMVSDTSRSNYASSNSLIRAGYKLYDPINRWSFDDGNYWIKRL